MPGCPRSARRRAAGAVAAVAAAALAVGCGGGGSVDALLGEPVLDPPPGATELLRASGAPSGGGLMGVERPGWVEVVWASPASPDDVAAYYRATHGTRYGLYREPLPAAGAHVLSGLAPKSGDRYPAVRIVVRPGSAEPVRGDAGAVAAAPPGTRTYVTVHVTTG